MRASIRHREVSSRASTFSYAGAADPPGLPRKRQGAGASAGVGVGVARAGAPREAAERRRGVPVLALEARLQQQRLRPADFFFEVVRPQARRGGGGGRRRGEHGLTARD